MKSTTATAPGKVILFGEHAVVYGRAAIAVPVTKVKATATVMDAPARTGCTIFAPDIGARVACPTRQPIHLLWLCAWQSQRQKSRPNRTGMSPSSATSPSPAGMGSGAAVSAALARAVLAHCAGPSRRSLAADTVNRIVYATEKLITPTPVGSTIPSSSTRQPSGSCGVKQPQVFDIALPFHLVIADTGIASSTGKVVADVRRAWQEDTKRYEAIFDRIGALAEAARRSIGAGDVDSLGR